MKDFEKIKDNVCFRLVNREANKEMLKEHPYIEVMDLAMLFYYKRSEGFKENGTTIITERDRKRWGITKAKLYKVARQNTAKLLPIVFQTIEQVINDIAESGGMLGESEKDPKERMYVLTNEEKYFGAGCFLYPKALAHIYEKLKVDFFVLPSSVHEVIIMPNVGSVNAPDLQSLVMEMNEQFLEVEEVLSDHVYHYDVGIDELGVV